MPSEKAIELAMRLRHNRGANSKTAMEVAHPAKAQQRYSQEMDKLEATLIDEAVQPMVDALKECAKGVIEPDEYGEVDYVCPSCCSNVKKHDDDCAIMTALRGWEATDDKS